MKKELNFPMKRFIAMAMVMILFAASLVTVTAATVRATVIVDGKTTVLEVFSSETSDILSRAKVKVSNKDLVERSDSNGIVINVKTGFDVKLTAYGFVASHVAHYGDTVQDVLTDAGIVLGSDDVVEPALTSVVNNGTKISVIKKVRVTVTADGQTKTLVIPEDTVGNVLISQRIILGKNDTVNVARSASVTDGMAIVVSRVTYREVTATEEIPFEIVSTPSDTLMKGTTKIVTPGVAGTQVATRREKLVDGKVVESTVLNATVTQKPVAQVQLVGTKVQPSDYATIEADGTVYDREGRQVSYTKVLNGKCTAYTSNGGYTSTGKRAQVGYIAVDPDIIPYGTRLFICSPDGKTVYGYAIAADTGGAMVSGRILADLYYDTESQCNAFGVRNMALYVLD